MASGAFELLSKVRYSVVLAEAVQACPTSRDRSWLLLPGTQGFPQYISDSSSRGFKGPIVSHSCFSNMRSSFGYHGPP